MPGIGFAGFTIQPYRDFQKSGFGIGGHELNLDLLHDSEVKGRQPYPRTDLQALVMLTLAPRAIRSLRGQAGGALAHETELDVGSGEHPVGDIPVPVKVFV